MSELAAFTTIAKIADEACLDINDLNRSKYQRFENWALECIQEFELNMQTTPITKSFTLTPLATLDWCKIDGYVDWCKIGTMVGDRLKVFVLNNRILKYHHTDICGNEQPNSGYPDIDNRDKDGYYFFNANINNRFYDTYYGFGNGGEHNQGQFDLDVANKRFQFSSEWANREIILEYITTGISINSETIVSEKYRKMVKSYIKYQYALHNSNFTGNDKITFERIYETEKMVAMRRRIDFGVDEVLAMSRASYMGVPKGNL